MRNWIALSIVFSLALCLGPLVVAQESDEEAINMMADKWVEAWNNGNIDAIAELYATDADFVGIDGIAYKGRDAVVQSFKDLASTAYKGAQIKVAATRIRFIKPNLAVGDNTWEFTGVQPMEGQQAPTQGASTFVVMKQDDQWVLVAHRSYVPTQTPSN